MKTGAIIKFRVMISLMVVAITASGVAGQEGDAVLDVNGDQVMSNTTYTLIRKRLSKPDLVISSYQLESSSVCPQGIVLSEFMTPTPFIFEYPSDDHLVWESTKLNIRFGGITNPCEEEPTFWRVGEKNSEHEDQVVLKPNNESMFTVQKSKGFYKLVFEGVELGLTKESPSDLPDDIWRLTTLGISNEEMGEVDFVPAELI